VGEGHPDTLIAMHNLARAYIAAGRTLDAEPMVSALLKRLRPIFPKDHVLLASSLHAQGECWVLQQKYADAKAPLEESLAILKTKQFMPVRRHDVASLLGVSLAGQRKYAEAEPLLLNSYKALKEMEAKLKPAEKKLLADGLDRIIELYEAWGKADEAAQWKKVRQEGTKSEPPVKEAARLHPFMQSDLPAPRPSLDRFVLSRCLLSGC